MTVDSMTRPRILVVEDEASLQELLAYNLKRAGFAVEQAYDADEARTLIAEQTPDLVILDWMLPYMSGLELCRQMRRQPATANLPIIMLTARVDERDRVHGLDTGADDYIIKPFSVEELLARVRAVLRRIRPAFASEVLRFADLTMDLAAHRVSRSGRDVHLSPTEFRLLRQLLERPGRVFSRDQLLDLVWGRDQGRRAAHGRCHDPPSAPGAERRRGTRPPAHCARHRLCSRLSNDTRVDLGSGPSIISAGLLKKRLERVRILRSGWDCRRIIYGVDHERSEV